MRALCWLGLHRWQLLTDWMVWIDVQLPLRNFDAKLRCGRCGKRKYFEQEPIRCPR